MCCRTVIIATGSEVPLAIEAQKLLAQAGTFVRVVSMPATTVFDRQDESYRERVLPRDLPGVAVEAGIPEFWRKYVGRSGALIGIDRFGDSAPAGELFRHLGFTAEHVVNAVHQTGRRRVERQR
jgi:transketolase